MNLLLRIHNSSCSQLHQVIYGVTGFQPSHIPESPNSERLDKSILLNKMTELITGNLSMHNLLAKYARHFLFVAS